MNIRVDFIDVDDMSCRVAGFLSRYRAVHVGLRFGDYYLLPTATGKSQWMTATTVERFLMGKIVHSFDICPDPDNFNPELTIKVGEGHVMSSLLWRLLTEWPHYFYDSGFRMYRPKRTNCVFVITSLLSTMGITTTTSTPYFLWKELTLLSLTMGSGILPHDPRPHTE